MKKINRFAIVETALYRQAEREGRVFDNEMAAAQFKDICGAGYVLYAVVDSMACGYREFQEYVHEYIALPKHSRLPCEARCYA